MTEEKLQITHSCAFTLTTYEGISHKDVCLEYTEHSTDHWHSDSETSIDLDADKARSIIDFLHKAFPEIAAHRKPLTGEEMNQIEARWEASMHGSKIAFAVRETEAAHGIKENT